METKQKIEIIERTLDALNRLSVTGVRGCALVYTSASELERLLHVLRCEDLEEQAARAGDNDDDEE